MPTNSNLNQAKKDPEQLADEMAERVVEILGNAPLVGRVRKSHLLSAIVGAAGVALFIVGVEKVFDNLPGVISIFLGLLFMSVAGVLFNKL